MSAKRKVRPENQGFKNRVDFEKAGYEDKGRKQRKTAKRKRKAHPGQLTLTRVEHVNEKLYNRGEEDESNNNCSGQQETVVWNGDESIWEVPDVSSSDDWFAKWLPNINNF